MRHDPATVLPTLGSEINHVVSGLDDVEVVLDDDDGVPLIDELAQHVEEPLRILEVQPGGGLVEDVERAPGSTPGEFLASFTRCASPPLSVVAD